MMSIIRKLGLRLIRLRSIGLRLIRLRPIGLGQMGLIVLLIGGLVACSSTQKLSYSQMQQRVPLSEEQQDELIKRNMIKITEHTHRMIKSVHQSLALSVTKVAAPDYNIRVTQVKKQGYAAPWIGAVSLFASVGALLTPLAFAGGASALAAEATAGLALGFSGFGGIIGGISTIASSNSWPYRMKIVYTATDKFSKEKLTGHCSAYFINSQTYLRNKRNRHEFPANTTKFPIWMKRKDSNYSVADANNRPSKFSKIGDKGTISHLRIPYEIDGCTQESIFPENKPGKLRIGSKPDIIDRSLGQQDVVATGYINLSWVDKKTKEPSKDVSSIHYKTHMVRMRTQIESHKTQFETLVPLN